MPANIRNIALLREFRARLIAFAEELELSLQTIQADMQKTAQWIEHDRPRYWENATRRAFDNVAATRTALNTCLMRTVGGRRPSCIEEKEAHLKAKRRLEHCQHMIEHVKRWTVKVHHEQDEFRARLSGVRRLLESDIPKSLAYLDKVAGILEEYAEVPRPGEGTSQSTNAQPSPSGESSPSEKKE